MIPDPCLGKQVGRRRIFWTTHLDVCDDYTLCGANCVIPGLVYEDNDDPYPEPSTLPPSSGYRTIKTDGWLESLIINILNTRARTDMKCPSPAAVFGHWSESYRDDNMYIGSKLWNAAEKSYRRCNDAVSAIEAAIKADMAKLVGLGVADSVDVAVDYRNYNAVDVIITAYVTNVRHVVNLSGKFVTDTWVWH